MMGIGAMLHYLGGGSKHSSDEYVGKKIIFAAIEDNALYIAFEDKTQIRIYDNGQSCCEMRYMTCDDAVTDLVDNLWISAEIMDGPSIDMGKYGETHEQQFLVIKTSGGLITIANHNEHNGYYGGFGLTIEQAEDE